ncbi:Transcription elongation factor SPT6 [Hypsibius exemplaris]|uniref:Transcription elongation factor SPT6 n=1 Tax=Hypsibius exemplaris TaxID=2072580 RepID=A0A9X6N8R2_HYPEX|nr:Transcription elongation factor SPT6 [Hypsibius exemplaris]
MAEFMDDEVEDDPVDEDVQEDEEDRKRKRDDYEADEDLEDDGHDLLEENLGVKVKRGPKFHRVRAMEAAESDEETGGKKGRKDIEEELFGGVDDGEEEAAPRPDKVQQKRPSDRAPRLHAQDEDMQNLDNEEESDDDSFIVDDDGQPIHGSKARGARRYDDAALQEAQDIFGLDFDVEDLEEAENESDSEGEYEEEDEDGEVIRHTRRKKNRKSIMEVYEPSDLEHNLKTQQDNEIRLADQPERFQLRSIPVEAPKPPEKAAAELLEEARWIHRHLFDDSTLSNQRAAQKILRDLSPRAATSIKAPADGGWGIGGDSKAAVAVGLDTESRIMKIKEILEFIRVQSYEVQFIVTYRREHFEPEFTREDIQEIYERDLLWMQLQRRRVNLVKLMTKMQDYLQGVRLANPSSELEEGDEVSDEAIEQVRNATTLVELADLFSEFKMIFGRHLAGLHTFDVGKKPARAMKKEKPVKKEEFDEDGNAIVVEDEPEEDAADDDATAEEAAVTEADRAGHKRAVRSDPFFLYKQAGLHKFVEKFGITAAKLAENVEGMFQINEIESENTDPDVFAEAYLSTRCPTVADVQKGAVSMMAWLIAKNAHFRRVARRFFIEQAALVVQATARGLKEIDENHPCYGVKWLRDKPLRDLTDDQYLKIFQAKKEGLLEMKIQIPLDREGQSGKDLFMAKVIPLLTVDFFAKEVTAWNSLRVRALEKAMSEILYPAFEKEVHEQLLLEAKSFVKAQIRRKLFQSINVAPYIDAAEQRSKDEKWEEGPFDLSDGIRVMGIAFEDVRDAPGYAVVIDGYGEVLESVKLPNLMKMSAERGINRDDMEKLTDLFRDRKPHAIAIASETRKALDLKDALISALNVLPADEKGSRNSPPVEIVDNLLSILYQNSETGRMEFPNHPPVLRQAISVARRLWDPLLSFTQLYNMDEDILNLNFHPLQSQLAKEEFKAALQVEFVRRVNEVGVDLNRCISHPLTHGCVVQFVCGLGPRKAQHLMKIIKQNGVIVSRNQLVMICRLGPKVFVNCAGFIKINVDELSDTVTGEQYVEPLDASRIHPEAYEWARKMCVDALDLDETADGANPSDAVVEVLEKYAQNPDSDVLEALDLNAFADELKKLDLGDKLTTLHEIHDELRERFREKRAPYASPGTEQIFEMIVGEPITEYRKGRLLAPTVTGLDTRCGVHRLGMRCCTLRKCPTPMTGFVRAARTRLEKPEFVFDHQELNGGMDCKGYLCFVKVYLDNGVSGGIGLENLSDKQPIDIPQERVKRGMIIHARLLEDLDPAKFYGKFTCRSTHLVDKDNEYKPQRDRYYDVEAEQAAMERELRKRIKLVPKTNFLKRVIAHPAFKNVNFEEAEKYLSGAAVPAGEAVIRPSSKSNSKLTLSWKIANGILDHVDITEKDKENAFSLGRRLTIDDEEYDDLDEILARYVQPMATLVGDLVQHKYHVDSHGGQPGTTRPQQREVIDKWLREQKAAMPNRIPFCFSECVTAPRRFFLCHLPRDSVREEFLTVTPLGYTYRRQNFNTLNHLIKYFKDHFHEAPPAQMGSTPHGASVTPGTGMSLSGRTPGIAAINQAFKSLPPNVLERLQQAGGSTSRSTPNVFATPRTPQSQYNPNSLTPSGITPSGATPSGAAPWGKAAQMWQKAMTGQPSGNTPGTPGSIPATPGSVSTTTNWGAAAEAWVSGNMAPPPTAPPPKRPANPDSGDSSSR